MRTTTPETLITSPACPTGAGTASSSTGVPFMDSWGLSAPVGIRNRLIVDAGVLRLVITEMGVRKIFLVTGSEGHVFLMYDSAEAAMT
ncbi:hypothetical protein [Streptomyces sp. MK5]|uniref:hypothetical protein n=1 Tax=Streptomyces sp. MK5 TaxID=3064253 RepID=UPI002741D4BC|nr:hypothetical protein [Streptomyces sp. MK5]